MRAAVLGLWLVASCTTSDVLLELRPDAASAEPGVTPDAGMGPDTGGCDGDCGTPCGSETCRPDQICQGIETSCALRPAHPLPLVRSCVPRPADCTTCACLGPLFCPRSAFFCHDATPGVECRCQP